MPVEKDVEERVWCPGPWPWEWFDTCIETRHKWCYNFSWLKRTGWVAAIYHEGCENGQLYTWFEFGFGIATLDTTVPAGEMCFDSPRTHEGVCDGSNTGLAASPLTEEQQQRDWRYCHRCHAMFFDGYPEKGVCPAGGGHVAAGFNFALPHDVAGSEWAQRDWRYCHRCHALFYDGYADKGVCAAGGGHVAAGYVFVLPHEVPGSEWAQRDWRYCHRCHALFYDGYADKGVCPARGGHAAAGFNFVLRHG